jgi:hypothetical protein
LSEEDEKAREREEERRAWLGDPIEHGGGYRPARQQDPLGEAALWGGCCLFEAAAGILAAFALPTWFLLG